LYRFGITGVHSAGLRADGHIIRTSIERDGQRHSDTLQCRHCQAHWEVIPGSGQKRGWCMRCKGPTCGRPECDPCIPSEAKLDAIDGG